MSLMRPAIFPKATTILVHWKIILPILGLIILADYSTSGAQSFSPNPNLSLEDGAQLRIEGSAGVIDFTCRAKQLSGVGEIGNTEQPTATVKGEGGVKIIVTLPVQALDCGKRAMNKDMYEALKSEQYPKIRYQLLEAHLIGGDEMATDSTSGWMDIRTKGIMEIAGVQDTTSFTVQGKVLDNQQFRVKGVKPIHMDTYDITPPRAMFGLIKANKNLTVYFDVIVKMAEK